MRIITLNTKFLVAFALTFLILTTSQAQESELDNIIGQAQNHITMWQVGEASRLAGEALETASNEEETARANYLMALTEFYRSNYGSAEKYAQKALDSELLPEDETGYLGFIAAASGQAPDFKEIKTEHFIIRYENPRDRVLALYAKDVLEKSHYELGLDLETYPVNPVVVEIYPDMDSFTLASTLPPENVKKTGVVGICKFNRIMILSPRLLPKGYTWSDTLAHEFVHYLVFIKSGNTVPVWLHEGIAKFKEDRWKDSGGNSMSPFFETILAEALRDDTLVPIEKMHPSLAMLDSAREAQLAFAQSSTTISFLVDKWGREALVELLVSIKKTGDYREAIRAVTGLGFDEFYGMWKENLRSKGLKEKIPDMKVKGIRLSNNEENRGDDSQDLVDIDDSKARDFTRLGDLLKARGRLGPAAFEYEKALEHAPASPVISTRLAGALIETGKTEKAQKVLDPVLDLYPNHIDIHMVLGRIYIENGNLGKALETYQNAISINPFNPEVHLALEAIYEARGEMELARFEKEMLDILYYGEVTRIDK